ncbi:hypothetical protein B1B04_01640 [Lysinibacillus sp. KCTC 33748]|nr:MULTISPECIES: hypothetical protein [unclassified Lysinibacillus]OXS77132.1 hypothetical protein B1B04_01640 [Lysinibacillus sp. KCTC 33748]
MKKSFKRYNRLLWKIEFLSLFHFKQKAIELLLKHLKQHEYPIEIEASGLVRLGHLYVDLKDFEQAAEIYHKAYLLAQELEFRYNSTEKEILSIFQKAGRHDLYAYWYEDFLNRAKYDKRFKKLQRK